MNLEAFFEWKEKESKSLRETKKKSDKKSWLERKNNYLHIKNKYNKCITAAKEDWILSKDGVVNGLCYNPKKVSMRLPSNIWTKTMCRRRQK